MKRHRSRSSTLSETGAFVASCARVDRRQFAESGIIDEYCITVAPALTPADHPFLGINDAVETEIAGHLVDDTGFTYLRLRAR
jgi:riboflavin biosynthesis pyrimidine reductase